MIASLPVLVVAVLGFFLGLGTGLLFLRGRLRLERARAAAESDAQRIQAQKLSDANAEAGRRLGEAQERIAALSETKGKLDAQLEAERRHGAESRDRLKLEFKELADSILEEKTKKFTEQNKVNLEGLLTPLGAKIKEFEKKVEDSYGRERDQVVTLSRDIETLKQTSLKMGQDAVNLANALKGQSKMQGNLGEIILERVLEKAGLTRDREYRIQVNMNGENGRRYQPDVIVDLPEGKHIIIDSKVSLTAYERYFSSDDQDVREAELKNHLRSLRQHLEGLSVKAYQNLYQLQSLDFVFLFMPIEPALTLAVQNDVDLFQDAFAKNIVIASPSTLLATLRTVSSLWRQEDQNRNAVEIARQSGLLYDKFAAFLEDLEKVGRALSTSQKSYEEALGKLAIGKGNLISRAEKLKKLGAKTSKEIPYAMLQSLPLKFEVPVPEDAVEDED